MPFITTNDGVELAYTTHGEGACVLFVHGWSGSSVYFSENLELARSCKVVTYDHRFHGESSKPEHGFHISRLAMDMRQLILTLGLDAVTVVGTSMGCAIIWSYIELFGEDRLRQAVFVDQAPLQNRLEDWSAGSKGCYDAASLDSLQKALKDDMAAFARGNLDCCASLPLSDDVVSRLTNATLRCDPDHLGKLMADHTQLDWRPILPRITLPCLNCIGGRSGVFPVEGCKAVNELIPGCKAALFREANHWLYLEQPQKFNQLLDDFVHGRDVPDFIEL